MNVTLYKDSLRVRTTWLYVFFLLLHSVYFSNTAGAADSSVLISKRQIHTDALTQQVTSNQHKDCVKKLSFFSKLLSVQTFQGQRCFCDAVMIPFFYFITSHRFFD